MVSIVEITHGLAVHNMKPTVCVVVGMCSIAIALTSFILIRQYRFIYSPGVTTAHSHDISAIGGSTGAERARILLVTYHRSGSSFLGEMFGQNPDAFYWFEPLRSLFQDYPAPLRYYEFVEDYYEWDPIRTKYRALATEQLSSFLNTTLNTLNCDVTSMDTRVLEDRMFVNCHHMPRNRKYTNCLKRASGGKYKHNLCRHQLQKTCESSDVIAAKVIRFPLYLAHDVITRDSKVKVIYYTRDPRAIMTSRQTGFSWKDDETLSHTKRLCENMAAQWLTFQSLKKQHGNRVMLVRYEDFAEKPKWMAEKIYSFIDRKLPKAVSVWIDENTTRDDPSWDILGTTRNSSDTARHWRRTQSRDVIRHMTAMCSNVLRQHGYQDSV